MVFSLSMFIGFLSFPVSVKAAVAKSATFSEIVSSEESTPWNWTLTIDGDTLTAVINDINAPEGIKTSLHIKDTSYSSWGTMSGHKSVLFMDISGLSSGNYTVILYEEDANDPLHQAWSIAEYVITKNESDIYFKSPAGGSEKRFITNLNKNYNPLEYNGFPIINSGSRSIIYLGKQKINYKEKLNKVITKAEDLCKNASSDMEKVRLIHDWIANNLAYDYESYFGGSISNAADPFWAYENKRAVCSGFSRLAKLMFSAVNIPCMCITGKTLEPLLPDSLIENVEYNNSNHAWNVVFVNNEWKILDITWDCRNAYLGKYNGTKGVDISGQSPNYTYFLVRPEQFGFNHISLEVNSIWSKTRIVKHNGYYYLLKHENNEAWYLFSEKDNCDTIIIGGEINYNGELYPITKITRYAFYGNASLKEITVLSSVKVIEQYAFANCRNLRKAVLADEIEYIEKFTFSGCESLQEIMLPSSLYRIKSKAFLNCSSLNSITVPGSNLYRIAKDAFENAREQPTIYCSKEIMKKYKRLFKTANATLELIDQPET